MTRKAGDGGRNWMATQTNPPTVRAKRNRMGTNHERSDRLRGAGVVVVVSLRQGRFASGAASPPTRQPRLAGCLGSVGMGNLGEQGEWFAPPARGYCITQANDGRVRRGARCGTV